MNPLLPSSALWRTAAACRSSVVSTHTPLTLAAAAAADQRTRRRITTATTVTMTTLATTTAMTATSTTPRTTAAAASLPQAFRESVLASLAALHGDDEDPAAAAAYELRWLLDKLLHQRIERVHRIPRRGPAVAAVGAEPAAATRAALRSLHAGGSGGGGGPVLHPRELARLAAWVRDRTVRNKPLQYVLGTQPFLGADLLVHPPTLIPRWETEEWVDRVADRLVARSTDREEGGDGSRIRVLDLCTGTGCVALGLANRVPRVHAVGVDVRPAAVRLARLNARRAGLLGRSAFHCADIWELVGLLEGGEGTRERAEAGRRGKKSSSLAGVVLTAEGYFDVVTANPPYVTAREHSALGASVREWEDERALVAGEEGLAFYAAVCKVARGVLRELPATTTAAGSGGLLVPRLAVEVGEGQAAEVASIVREHLGVKAPLSLSSRGGGWVREVVVWRDMAGVERCVVGLG